MTCGVLCKAQSRSAGYGLPWLMRRGSSWRLGVAPMRRTSAGRCRPGDGPVVSHDGNTDDAGVYQRQRRVEPHAAGQPHTHKIERTPLTVRTRMARFARQTMCFSKSIIRHASVLGLFMTRDEVARPLDNPCQQIWDTTVRVVFYPSEQSEDPCRRRDAASQCSVDDAGGSSSDDG